MAHACVSAHLRLYGRATLPPDLLSQVEQQPEHCDICSASLDSTRNIVVLIADERVFELPPRFSERLHERVENEIKIVSICGSGGPLLEVA
jgi:hypothetical protein